MSDIVIRDDIARKICGRLCADILHVYRASEVARWHTYKLNRVHISDRDNTEVDILLERGFKSTINLSIDIIPDESVDRLSDRLIDTIKINLKNYIIESEDLPIEFSENEYISDVEINRRSDFNQELDNSKHIIRINTNTRESIIIENYKLHNNPRINGKRILVSDIYSKYNMLGDYEGLESIVNDFDGLLTMEEVEKAVNFAKNSDKIEPIENDVDKLVSPNKKFEKTNDKKDELKKFEDNR